MAKVLCTGAAGFIGSHICDRLVEDGHEVVGIDNLSTGKLDNLNPHIKFEVSDVEFCIPEKDGWGRERDFDYIFHTAAKARVQPSIEDPVSYHRVNVLGTLNLLEYCKRSGAKMIFSGSSSIFDDSTLPFYEDTPKNPKSPYALQKHIAEQYIRLYGELYDIDYTILRYFNVFGERQITEGAYAAVVGIFMNQKAEGKPLTIFGDGEKRRDFTYVKDVVEANILGMENSGTYNVGRGDNNSVNELADAVGGEKTYLDERPGESQETLADNSKLRALGWKPSKNILEWVHEVS